VCGHDGVSHSCHIFGAISGLLTGYFLLKNKNTNEIEELCIKAAFFMFVLLVFGLLATVLVRNYLTCGIISISKYQCGKS
jgi:hypothetical protein